MGDEFFSNLTFNQSIGAEGNTDESGNQRSGIRNEGSRSIEQHSASGGARQSEKLQFDRASGVLLVATTRPVNPNPVVVEMASQGFF